MRVITDTGELDSLDTIIIQGRGELDPYNQRLRFKSGKDYTHPDFSAPTYNSSTQTYDFTWANRGPYVALVSPRDGSVGTPVWSNIGLEYIDSTLATAGDVITFNGLNVVWSPGGGGGGGGVTSVSLSMPSAFTVTGSPVTSAGTFIVSGAGTSSQYIDGTGALQTFPSVGGGGIKSGTATQVSAGVYTTTISGVTSYTAGDTYIIKFDSQNDGDSTLNISSVGAIPIYKNTNVKLSSGDIKANQEITIVYDGTNFQAIGLVSTQLLAYVHNSEGAVINKGQVVYAYQATGNKMSVKLARADSDATSAKTIGMVYDSSIGVGADGYIIIQGVIEGINTAAYSAGDTLYLSGTTFGSVTNVKPYAPTHLVYVGIVERSNAGNGQIYVRCQNGYELDEIHDVDLITTPPVNNDLLTYVTGSPNLWKNRSLGSILGGTTSQYVRGDGTLATTPTGTVTGVTATAPLTSSGGATPDISTSMATNRLIGRSTAGTGVMEEIQVGNFLTLSGGVLSSVPPVELSQVYTTAWNLAPTIISPAASGGSGSSANQWYIIPKYLSPNTSISEIGVRITSFTTSLTARLAIYTSTYDSTNKGFIPDSRVANSGALTITGTGFVSFTLPSTIQVSGWVFFVVGYTATTCSFRTVNSNSVIGLPALVNSGSPLNTDTTVRNGMYTNTTNARTADPPNPWSGTLAQNNANIPAIYFFVP